MHAPVAQHDEVGLLPAGHVHDHVGRMPHPGVGLDLHALHAEGGHVVLQVPLDVLLALVLVTAAGAVRPHQVDRRAGDRSEGGRMPERPRCAG